jgi:uncharacterized protein
MSASQENLHLNNLILHVHRKRSILAVAALSLWAVLSLACSISTIQAGQEAQPAVPMIVETANQPLLQLEAEPIEQPLPTAAAEEAVDHTISIISTALPESLVSAPETDVYEQVPTPVVDATAEPAAEISGPGPIDIYAQLRLESLAERSYGGGELVVHQVLEDNRDFIRYLISYPSDELTIYGFMNQPKMDPGPFPVVIALHGYIDPAAYHTLDYTTHYADTLARAGFLVLHPNLRGYPPSGSGENLFRVGMAIDVLNLIALVKEQGGRDGPLEKARSDSIGMWGHSMGGGITLRVTAVSRDLKAAVLYGAMSGDERQNFEAINLWSNGMRGLEELAVPMEELLTISPIYYLDRIEARLSIHHGEHDQLVPLSWSLDLCQRLEMIGKAVQCFTYPGQPHAFNQAGNQIFNQRVIEFLESELK